MLPKKGKPCTAEITFRQVNTHPTLLSVGGGDAAELHRVREVVQFIYEKGQHSNVFISREDGAPFITTFGFFIDKLSDMEYWEELPKGLVALQMGEPDGGIGGMSIWRSHGN